MIEFLYDRRILGFDSGDQVGVVEAVLEGMGSAAGRLSGLGSEARYVRSGFRSAGTAP